ncbi:hypothetical protein TWF718_002148 [Orbilia javanica]|uniref:Uncharacterized protein n=1 Tax=Orbilia javanica TaxID=47235 RepID=A0AAN8MHA8_9PEZI
MQFSILASIFALALCQLVFASKQEDIHIKSRRVALARRSTDSVYTHRAVDEYVEGLFRNSEHSLKYLRYMNEAQYRLTPTKKFSRSGTKPVGSRCRLVTVKDSFTGSHDDRIYFRAFGGDYRRRSGPAGFAGYEKKFRDGSQCFPFDYKLTVILDMNTNFDSYSLSKFEKIQKDKSLQPISVSIAGRKVRAKLTENGLTGTYKVVEGYEIQLLTPPKVSVERFKEILKELKSRYATLTDLIDAWTCKAQLSDKSAVYYTLFLREEKDAALFKFGPIVPQLATFPEKIADTIKQFSPDFDAEIDDFVNEMKNRFQKTKELMESFGGSESTLDDFAARSVQCDKARRLIPGEK